jgi:type IV pilus assembly protein PilW
MTMKRSRRAGGFTLIEFMIAATVSLIMLAALSAAFVGNSRARDELDRSYQQLENGRYAIQVMTDDVEMAGFLAQYDIDLANPATPGSKPDPCLTDLPSLRAALPLPIQGYDNASALSCLTDVKAGTDVVVVRRASSCVSGSANCPAVAGAPYFQASLCSSGTELQSTNKNDFYRLDTVTANLNRTQRNCTTLAQTRQYLVHIYFVANNDQAGDGIPTLKRAELGVVGGNLGFTIVPIAEGIETFQVEYGIDFTATAPLVTDGQPDVFTANPDAYTAAPGNCPTTAADCVTNWRNTTAIKVNLLARNTSTSLDFTDTKTYTLGLKADGTANTFGPFNDSYKRHSYTTSIRLNNVAGRRVT